MGRLPGVFVWLVCSGAAGADPPPAEIVYGGDSAFPPYEFLDSRGEPAGLNVDLIRAVAVSQGFRVRVELAPWAEIRAGLPAGRYDVAAMYRSAHRAREVDFAIPHELIYHEMFVPMGAPGFASLSAIAGRRVLAQTGTLTVDALRELGLGGGLVLVASEPEALRALVRGEGDVAIVTQTPVRPFLSRAEFAGRIVSTGPPVLLTEYAFVTRPGRRALVEALNQGVASVKASGEYQRLFDRWLRPDRSAGPLRIAAWAAGGLLAVALLAFVRNRMLRRRLARLHTSHRELIDYQAELNRVNQELEAFSYSVSHDLRAPLRAIDGYTRMLAEDYAAHLDAEARRICGVITEQVRHMSRMIDGLLELSRSSRAAMERSPTDMQALAAEEFQRLGTANVHFELEPLPPVAGDERLLRQVWANLLSNAVKFSANGDQPAIRVSGREADGRCSYAVEDNGAGFDPRHAGRLFGVFQRLHPAREFHGTGIGLANVRRIVERHGGRVWAEGQPGEGATFYFELPCGAVSNNDAAT